MEGVKGKQTESPERGRETYIEKEGTIHTDYYTQAYIA